MLLPTSPPAVGGLVTKKHGDSVLLCPVPVSSFDLFANFLRLCYLDSASCTFSGMWTLRMNSIVSCGVFPSSLDTT